MESLLHAQVFDYFHMKFQDYDSLVCLSLQNKMLDPMQLMSAYTFFILSIGTSSRWKLPVFLAGASLRRRHD